MKALRCILTGLIALLLSACGPAKVDYDRLERAEAIALAEPDSALNILDSIAPTGLRHDRFRARATVARAEACYVSHRPLPGDSAFKATIATLSQKEPDAYLMRAYFLNGYRKVNEQRYIDAIVDLLLAENIATTIGNAHFGGLAQRNIADAFDRMDDHASALVYYKKSAETFRADPDSAYYYWGLYNVARAYNNVLEYGKAIKLSDSISRKESVIENPILYDAIIGNLAIAKLNNNQSSEALELFKALKLRKEFNALDFYNLGRAYLNLNMIAEARACSDSVKAIDPTDTSLDFSIARATKDNANIYRLIEDDLDYTNSEFTSIYKRNYAEVIDRFYRQTIDEQKSELRSKRLQFIIVLAVLGMFLIAAAAVAYILIRRKQTKIDETFSLVEQLSDALSHQTDDNSRLRSALAEGESHRDTYRLEARNQILAKLEAFNHVCDVYSDYSGNPKQLARRIEDFLTKYATQENLEEIRLNIDAYCDNIITRFRTDFPELSESDIDLFTLIIAGFKAPAIALYLGVDCRTVYTRKTRLKQKIQKANFERAFNYLSIIDSAQNL